MQGTFRVDIYMYGMVADRPTKRQVRCSWRLSYFIANSSADPIVHSSVLFPVIIWPGRYPFAYYPRSTCQWSLPMHCRFCSPPFSLPPPNINHLKYPVCAYPLSRLVGNPISNTRVSRDKTVLGYKARKLLNELTRRKDRPDVQRATWGKRRALRLTIHISKSRWGTKLKEVEGSLSPRMAQGATEWQTIASFSIISALTADQSA